MAQLTGNFQGTSEADIFSGSIGSEEITVADGTATGTAVKQVIIDTLGGNDIIEAETDFFAGAVEPVTFRSFLRANAIGMTNADINTGSDADTVTISSTATSLVSVVSTGLQNSFIETNTGRDTIKVSSKIGTGSDLSSPGTAGTGVSLATISAGANNDIIEVVSTTRNNPAEGSAEAADVGITRSTLLGDGGDDIITVKSEAASLSDAVSTGADQRSNIRGGDGSDRISVSAIAEILSFSVFGSDPTAAGISDGTFVEGGSGDDTITLSASADAKVKFEILEPDSRFVRKKGTAYGAVDSYVRGGDGQDTIKISGSIDSIDPEVISPAAFAYGIFNTDVDGGEGGDAIQIRASGSAESRGSTFHGAADSTIRGGLGSDTIEISVDPSSQVAASAGAFNSTVNGEDGNDTIKISGILFDIQDSLILGGSGDDILDTGMGAGVVLGGGGTDLLKLDFFDAATMSIQQAGANGVIIQGTADKLGGSASWSQEVFEVESYEVAGTTYDAAGVVNLLG